MPGHRVGRSQSHVSGGGREPESAKRTQDRVETLGHDGSVTSNRSTAHRNSIVPGMRLTLRVCADVLGVTTGFVRGEIKDGQLRAVVAIKRPGGRTLYRVDLEDFRDYCRKYCPRVLDLLPKRSPVAHA